MICQTFYSRRGEKKTKQTKTHKTLRSQMMPSKFTHFSTARGALHELLRSNVLGHFPFYAAQHLRQLCGRRQFVYFSLCGSVRTCQQEASNLLEARFWPANSIKRPFVFLCVCSQQSVWRALFLFMYVCVCVRTNRARHCSPGFTSSTNVWQTRNSFSCFSNSVRRFNKALNSSETTSPKLVLAHLRSR